MLLLDQASVNNVAFRSSKKPENQMKSGLVCQTADAMAGQCLLVQK